MGSVTGTFSTAGARWRYTIPAVLFEVRPEHGLGDFPLKQAMLLDHLPEKNPVHPELLDIVRVELQGLSLAFASTTVLGIGSTIQHLGGHGVEMLSDDDMKWEAVGIPPGVCPLWPLNSST